MRPCPILVPDASILEPCVGPAGGHHHPVVIEKLPDVFLKSSFVDTALMLHPFGCDGFAAIQYHIFIFVGGENNRLIRSTLKTFQRHRLMVASCPNITGVTGLHHPCGPSDGAERLFQGPGVRVAAVHSNVILFPLNSSDSQSHCQQSYHEKLLHRNHLLNFFSIPQAIVSLFCGWTASGGLNPSSRSIYSPS